MILSSLIISIQVFAASDVYVLNSIPNHFSLRYGSFNKFVESTYKSYLKGTSFNPIFIHNAKMEDYLALASARIPVSVFWIGHGSQNYVDSLDNGIITDSKGRNMAAVFKDLDHSFNYFSVVTCDSKEIINREDIRSFSGKISPTASIKAAVIDFHNFYEIERTCRMRRNPVSKRMVKLCQNYESNRYVQDTYDQNMPKESNIELSIELNEADKNPEILKVYINGKLIDILQKKEGNSFVVKVNSSDFLRENTNELVLSSVEKGKAATLYSLENMRVQFSDRRIKLKKFMINNISTLSGSVLFNF